MGVVQNFCMCFTCNAIYSPPYYNISSCATAAPESPSGVRLIDLRDGHITLSWTPAESTTCVPVNYRVTSNCSTCSSNTTNLTTDSCSLPQQWTDSLVCAFSVQSEICGGNLVGRLSNPSVVTFQGTYLIVMRKLL